MCDTTAAKQCRPQTLWQFKRRSSKSSKCALSVRVCRWNAGCRLPMRDAGCPYSQHPTFSACRKPQDLLALSMQPARCATGSRTAELSSHQAGCNLASQCWQSHYELRYVTARNSPRVLGCRKILELHASVRRAHCARKLRFCCV